MKLAEFLATNPDAKQEHDAALVTARAEGVTEGNKEGNKAGQAEVVARIEGCAPYIGTDKYPKPISEMAVKVLKGEEAMATLTTCVTVHDSTVENNASTNAQTETDGQTETPADETQALSTDGIIRNEDDMAAMIASARGEE